jgi:pyridoxine kinase
MKAPYTLAISSFAVHGTASLKTFITFLGDKILPVPSLVLNGLTNMSLVKKFDMPFRELLQSTFELAVSRELDLILYVGYLGNAEQADIILEMIAAYRNHIKIIITDPVCGDHGRTYVPFEVITKWPDIIRISDMVFPNLTELKILTGHQPDDNDGTATYVEQFKQLFQQTQLVVTSIKPDEDTIGFEFYGDGGLSYTTKILPKNYGGSGDAFVALFILNRFYKQMSLTAALKTAADQVHYIIKNSIVNNSDSLILQFTQLSDQPK